MLRDSLFAGIFVAGGEALTPGLIPRLEHELQCQVSTYLVVQT